MKKPKHFFTDPPPMYIKILEWAWFDGAIAMAISIFLQMLTGSFIDLIFWSLSFTLGAFLLWIAALYIWSRS